MALGATLLASGIATLIHPAAPFPVFLAALGIAMTLLAVQLHRVVERAREVEDERDKLRTSQRDMAGAVIGCTAGMARMDDRGRFVWVNPAYAEMLGYQVDEMVGMSGSPRVHPDDLERAKEAYERVQKSGIASVEVRAITKDDLMIYTHIDLSRPVDPDDDSGFFATVHDLTESKEIEAALALKSSELARLNTELEQFAYVAAHDLREPARKVISFASLLEQDFEGELPEKASRDLHFITDAARRMQELVQDLLVLSRASRTALNSE
jgi:PAS domain S-box-containing protein